MEGADIMAANIKTLKDKDSNIVYPQTLTTAIYDPDTGKSIGETLAGKQKTITISPSEPTSADGVDGDFWGVIES